MISPTVNIIGDMCEKAVKNNPTSVKVSVKVLWHSVNALQRRAVCVVGCWEQAFPTIGLWRQVSI